MAHIEEMFEQFSEKHPVWFWLLVRLAICFCWMFAAITAVIALAAVLAPFFGSVIGVWILVPFFVVTCWAFVYCALWLYKDFIESW